MRRISPLVLTLCCIWVGSCATQKDQTRNWPWAWNWVDGTPGRVASTDPTGGNRDSIAIQLGETVVLAEIEGAGIIRHIWLTTNADNPGRSHVIRMYWDGNEEPAVEVPLGDFFGVGHGIDAEMYSFPITVASKGRARNCWWPMPYSDGALITVTNEGPEVNGAFYYYIDYMEFDGAVPTKERFHAQYRQAYPADSPDEYVILDTIGRGRFMGVLFNVESTEPQWWGEGDDRIVIDGNPPILGTGTEDYFNDAWGMREYAGIWHGAPVVEGYDAAGLRSSMYRFHILDPLPFKDSFFFSIEHGHANDRADNLSSVAFWYQEPPTPPFPPMPSFVERLSADARTAAIRGQAWRYAASEDHEDAVRLEELARAAQTPANKAFAEGLLVYREARESPNQQSLNVLDEKLATLKELFEALPEEQRYEKAKLDLPTDDDNPVPNDLAAAILLLERAKYDIERRVALIRGFHPGDEIILESRRPDGTVTPPPAYEETADYADSYAKVEDSRLLGTGARFTYGEANPSWALFTPDIPATGLYEVFVIFSYGSNAADTRYEVNHREGSTVIPLEQRGRPGTLDRNNRSWISLGEFPFAAGMNSKNGSVRLISSPGVEVPNTDFEYRAYADAVRFVYRGTDE